MAALQHEERQPSDRTASRPAAPRRPVLLTRAELAPCTCPEACERDHEQD